VISVPDGLIGLVVGAAGAWIFVRLVDARSREAKRVEREEPRPDERFDRLIEALPLGGLVIDRRGHVVQINVAAEALFSIDARRAAGRALIEAVPSIELERHVAGALAGRGSTRNIMIVGNEGERTFLVSAYPIDEDQVLVLALDQTPLVALESVRREFISNVSHELRTPLSAIKLMVETVTLSDGDLEVQAMFLPKVLHEVDRMVQLVEDLLELARSESGRLPLRLEILALGEVTRSVLNTFAQRADSLGVNLSITRDDGVNVVADRDRITQILVNLIDNAVRHTPASGSVSLSIEREGEEAILRVRDTGIGIPYNDLPHIFERFYVVERSRARERSGTGLGLSIAKQLVELHGGTIGAESDLGAGSMFLCRFPVAVVETTADP
jgi:two-component system phosphate regulon sensor histidine kinase PhoR